MKKRCPMCGRNISAYDNDELHYECHNCGLFFCFDPDCRCEEGLIENE